MAERTPQQSRRSTQVQEDGFGGIVKGAAPSRHQAAWRRVEETDDISWLWRIGPYQKPDDWPDDNT